MDRIKKVTVVGLDRFVGLQWKVLGCDRLGCIKEFGGGDSYKEATTLRRDATNAGWLCNAAGDFCPDHGARDVAKSSL